MDNKLLRAVMDGHNGVVEDYINKGCSVSAQDVDGCTPLMWASRKGYFHMVRTLLHFGASVHDRNHAGETALVRTIFLLLLEATYKHRQRHRTLPHFLAYVHVHSTGLVTMANWRLVVCFWIMAQIYMPRTIVDIRLVRAKLRPMTTLPIPCKCTNRNRIDGHWTMSN
jgi:Ankyrin repeats (3 copies)